MIKYSFSMVDDEDGDGVEIVHTLKGERKWSELLPYFEEWLKGAGYIFDGHIEMVEQ